MMMGRRQFRRTTSMTGITVDDPQSPLSFQITPATGDLQSDPLLTAAIVSPRYSSRRRNSDNYNGNTVENMTADFLGSCGLCQRRLPPGRDIFMYRGDTAFCSVECREQQMKHDEIKDKCSMLTNNNTSSSSMPTKDHDYHHQATSEISGKSETVATA